jgi:hypothetical protein
MSYLDTLDPEALLDYKERAKAIYNGLNSNDNLQQAEALTNAALGLGLTLHHAGIIGKDGIFSGISDVIGDAKNVREAGENAMNSIKKLAGDKFDELTGGASEGDGMLATVGQTARNLLTGATGEGSGLLDTARGLLTGATGEGSGLLDTARQTAGNLLSGATGEGGGLASTARGLLSGAQGEAGGLASTARGLANEGQAFIGRSITSATGRAGNLADSVGEGGMRTVLASKVAQARQTATNLATQGEQELTGAQAQGTSLFSRVMARLRRPTINTQPETSGLELQDLSAFQPSDESNELISKVLSTGQLRGSELSELRSADPLQVSRILNGDVTELGQGMSEQLFDRLLLSRQKFVETGRTIGQQITDNNIYSHSAGDAINQARLSGELPSGNNNEPASGELVSGDEPTHTQTTLQEPSTSTDAHTLSEAQEGISNNIGTDADKPIVGEETLEQAGERTVGDVAGKVAGKVAGESALDELTADSVALDETPIGGLITVGLGIADLFENLFGLHHHVQAAPITQSGQQVGV